MVIVRIISLFCLMAVESIFAVLPDNVSQPQVVKSLFSPVSENSEFTTGAGLNVTFIPRRIAENTLRVVPMAELFLTKRFFSAWQWETSLGIVVVKNYFSTGLYYSYRLSNWSFGIGDRIEIWGGFLETTAFSAYAWSVAQHPGLIFSHMFAGKYAPWVPSTLSLRTYINVSGYQYTKVGEAEFSAKRRDFTGFGIDLTAEYNYTNYGIFFTTRINYNKADYGFWLAFSDFNLMFFYPTFILGMRF